VPKADKMCYSGTHDNQTLLGWIKSKWPQDDAIALYHDIIGKCLKTDADVVILPLQDVLCLDDSARMNVPGVAEGNWSWMADGDAVEAKRDYLKKLATTYGRKRK
jgi:4-alpha-glucanotransferase